MRDLAERTQTSIRKNTLVSVSNSYSPPEVLSEKNITIAFLLSNFYGEGDFDEPKYGHLGLEQFVATIGENGSRNYQKY
jgi:hypothetical protein